MSRKEMVGLVKLVAAVVLTIIGWLVFANSMKDLTISIRAGGPGANLIGSAQFGYFMFDGLVAAIVLGLAYFLMRERLRSRNMRLSIVILVVLAIMIGLYAGNIPVL